MSDHKNTLDKELESIKQESKNVPYPEDFDFDLETGNEEIVDEDTINDKIVSNTNSLPIIKNININDTADVFKKLEETAADLKIREEIEEEEKKLQKKPRKFTIIHLLITCIVIGCLFLCLSMYAYINRDAIKDSLKPSITPILSTNEDTESSTNTLPEELLNPDSITVLVNSTYSLAKDFIPSNLATPYLNSTTDVIQVKAEAGEQAKAMKEAAAEEGVTLVVSAGYMSYEELETRYMDMVSLNGEEYAKANGYTPGCSEHQTGLALDFTDSSESTGNTTSFMDTAAGQWLYAHAHEYGFILRYPEGKKDITGVEYSPWHYRYVGVDVATAIYNKGIELSDPNYTFEEYYGLTN